MFHHSIEDAYIGRKTLYAKRFTHYIILFYLLYKYKYIQVAFFSTIYTVLMINPRFTKCCSTSRTIWLLIHIRRGNLQSEIHKAINNRLGQRLYIVQDYRMSYVSVQDQLSFLILRSHHLIMDYNNYSWYCTKRKSWVCLFFVVLDVLLCFVYLNIYICVCIGNPNV